MNKNPLSAGRLRRLNRRQRKKLRLGEFQELVFEIRVHFHQPLDDTAHPGYGPAECGATVKRRVPAGAAPCAATAIARLLAVLKSEGRYQSERPLA